MNSLDSISKSAPVHLVFIEPDGRRRWFVRTDQKQHPQTREWTTWPVVDDVPSNSKPMSLEMALVALKRWRNELGLNVRIAMTPDGAYIDSDPTATDKFSWEHRNYLVTVTDTGDPAPGYSDLVYRVLAVNRPEGRAFCLRFSHPDLFAQAVFTPFEQGPEAPVRKAKQLGFLKLEPPMPNPHKAGHDAEVQRKEEQAANRTLGRLTGC